MGAVRASKAWVKMCGKIIIVWDFLVFGHTYTHTHTRLNKGSDVPEGLRSDVEAPSVFFRYGCLFVSVERCE